MAVDSKQDTKKPSAKTGLEKLAEELKKYSAKTALEKLAVLCQDGTTSGVYTWKTGDACMGCTMTLYARNSHARKIMSDVFGLKESNNDFRVFTTTKESFDQVFSDMDRCVLPNEGFSTAFQYLE